MNFEIASFSSLSGTQPITWQVEYPRKGTTDIAVSEIFISQKDLVGIVPLAMVSGVIRDAPVFSCLVASFLSVSGCLLQWFYGLFTLKVSHLPPPWKLLHFIHPSFVNFSYFCSSSMIFAISLYQMYYYLLSFSFLILFQFFFFFSVPFLYGNFRPPRISVRISMLCAETNKSQVPGAT